MYKSHESFVGPAFCFSQKRFSALRLQPAAQGFQGFPGFQVRLVRRSALVASLSICPASKVSLEGKNRRLKAFQPARDSSVSFALLAESPTAEQCGASSRWASTAFPESADRSKKAAAAMQSAGLQSNASWKSNTALYKSMSQGQTRFFSRSKISRALAKRSRAWTVFPCWP